MGLSGRLEEELDEEVVVVWERECSMLVRCGCWMSTWGAVVF